MAPEKKEISIARLLNLAENSVVVRGLQYRHFRPKVNKQTIDITQIQVWTMHDLDLVGAEYFYPIDASGFNWPSGLNLRRIDATDLPPQANKITKVLYDWSRITPWMQDELEVFCREPRTGRFRVVPCTDISFLRHLARIEAILEERTKDMDIYWVYKELRDRLTGFIDKQIRTWLESLGDFVEQIGGDRRAVLGE